MPHKNPAKVLAIIAAILFALSLFHLLTGDTDEAVLSATIGGLLLGNRAQYQKNQRLLRSLLRRLHELEAGYGRSENPKARG
ncbi:hypothetical protein GCM10009555_018000 [Acrocarpospora macrocephala]|uniref:Uncharacterized protein n=1 Tax=Acrocarpospora macrocephala TaxID=150177 RepID=A0A5M3WGP1_9ACTN|nr:hypothetical protein [Acrocarpospora macrocephala]GES07460.1 hypothetical protein Amac_010550 [Acrocarpospora macrocephala]